MKYPELEASKNYLSCSFMGAHDTKCSYRNPCVVAVKKFPSQITFKLWICFFVSIKTIKLKYEFMQVMTPNEKSKMFPVYCKEFIYLKNSVFECLDMLPFSSEPFNYRDWTCFVDFNLFSLTLTATSSVKGSLLSRFDEVTILLVSVGQSLSWACINWQHRIR